LPLPMGDLDPHLIHDSLCPSKPTTKHHFDWFSPFYRAYDSDRPCYSVCNNRLHLRA